MNPWDRISPDVSYRIMILASGARSLLQYREWKHKLGMSKGKLAGNA